jgi:hypothetical protein
MGLLSKIPQFQHIAEHGDGPALSLHLRERFQSKAHRLWIGIVGVVDQGLFTSEVDNLHPHGKGLKMLKGLFDLLQLDSEEARCGDGR